jgi:hypothetical protein
VNLLCFVDRYHELAREDQAAPVFEIDVQSVCGFVSVFHAKPSDAVHQFFGIGDA